MGKYPGEPRAYYSALGGMDFLARQTVSTLTGHLDKFHRECGHITFGYPTPCESLNSCYVMSAFN
jgi:hypothetical protein